MTGILLSCHIGSIRSLKDGSVSVNLETQELSPGKVGELFALRNQIAVCYISPKTINQNEIDQVNEIDPAFEGKSQSQRIRNVLYLLWKQNQEGYKDAKSYYEAKTELYIEHLKTKIL